MDSKNLTVDQQNRIAAGSRDKPSICQESMPLFPKFFITSILLQGKDLLVIDSSLNASFPEYKTFAFIEPTIAQIKSTLQQETHGPTMLLITRNKEQAVQIETQVRSIAQQYQMSTLAVYGGGQIQSNYGQIDILVATPGRLLDLISNNLISISNVSFLMMDEADLSLDYGFEPQIRNLCSLTRPDRQTCIISTTSNQEFKKFAEELCKKDFAQISLKTQISAAIEQRVILVASNDHKYNEVIEILSQLNPQDKVLIYVSSKKLCQDLAEKLTNQQIECRTLHGDKLQAEREQAIKDFQQSICSVLISTDVASRGIKLSGINYVILYDLPSYIEDYKYRITRTGLGVAITLIDMEKDNRLLCKEIVSGLIKDGQEVSQQLKDFVDDKK